MSSSDDGPELRRRNSERYQWEKDRVRLSEAERRSTGGTERDTGLSTHDLDFHTEYARIEADEDLASAFGVPTGTPLLRRVYRTSRRSGAVPLSASCSYLPYELVARNPDLLDPGNEPWPGGTQHQLHTVGVELARVQDQIRTRPPSPSEATMLDLEPEVSVLTLRKISVDVTGRVVEVADAVFPGDRTELVYTTVLKRWDA
ncbi:UTRA domain-containing protein [Plantactinospora sp. S1510]|uniref:UTRA domain-containing protein n=1 Tax=Plantactinospora alkalitolerans TaxID=2789879 RepID=A0ABS0HAS1_9ACTN|nr:UTRA domain-containing protein [Plantactinospora alkalitolerans]MBF9135406.1 UTRA domain-containing protein [Plantactinospora alkalitolerans]